MSRSTRDRGGAARTGARKAGTGGASRTGRAKGRGTQDEASQAVANIGGWVGWFVGAGIVLFVVLAMVSFDPADPPTASVVPARDQALNWCGNIGALVAHGLFELLGWTAWATVGIGALALGLWATGRRVSELPVRALGAVVLIVGLAGLEALALPGRGPVAHMGGGVVGTWLAGLPATDGGMGGVLVERIAVLGSTLALIVIVAVGLVVTFDAWVVVAAIWTGHITGRAAAGTARAGKAFAGRAAAAGRRAVPSVRANDIDDDETIPEADRYAKPEVVVRAGKRKERKEAKAAAKAAAHEAQAEEPQVEDAEAHDEEEDEDIGGAPQVFTEDQLREKISKLPVRFASQSMKVATDEQWRDIQNQAELEGYKFPSMELLEDPESDYSEKMEVFVREQAEALERALNEYRIRGEVVGIESGPVITMYEVRLAPGTKVSALSAVSSDLARALKAVNIRIVPNMAGRDTVGIEVPNAKKEKVRLKELMAGFVGPNAEMNTRDMKLPMFLGKDASGEPLVADLTKLPHMLIAGTTGSGKSVCMNTIIMSFLYTCKPNELKLVLVDPKMVEMSQFKDIPHLMCPVVTEMSKAAAILEWAVGKMDERYGLLAEAGVRDIAAYNGLEWEELKERFEPASEEEEARIPRKLPYMVFVIDELADLMMTNKEVEQAIVRIAQKARAVGIHLILATQRPQANVVTGLIKSNMPGRICFKVASGMDSRIVLDQKGGELLLGQGDMLFLTPSTHKLVRSQGTLVDDKETRRVVRFLKEIAAPSFERQLVQIKSESDPEGDPDRIRDGWAAAQEDPLFDQAVEAALETGRGSVSMLQRRLAIGYTRAARLVEMMGEAGILGSYKGTVAREVTMTLEEWHAIKEQVARDAAQANTQGKLFDDDEEDAAGSDGETDGPPASASASIGLAEYEAADELDEGDEADQDDTVDAEDVYDEEEGEDWADEAEDGEEDEADDAQDEYNEEADEEDDPEAQYEEDDDEAEDEYEYDEGDEDEDPEAEWDEEDEETDAEEEDELDVEIRNQNTKQAET